ncbi:MAG: hypothetical protein RR681_07750 [Lachnospiraceae bacterium]
MSSKTKLIVLHMKEIIYTTIFVILGILLILLLIMMFFSGRKEEVHGHKDYIPGVYTSTVTLNNTTLEVEVVVDKTHINSIRFVNLDETITTMYPLIQPAIEEISTQVYKQQSLENITYAKENAYTSQILVNAIDEALKKAISNK